MGRMGEWEEFSIIFLHPSFYFPCQGMEYENLGEEDRD